MDRNYVIGFIVFLLLMGSLAFGIYLYGVRKVSFPSSTESGIDPYQTREQAQRMAEESRERAKRAVEMHQDKINRDGYIKRGPWATKPLEAPDLPSLNNAQGISTTQPLKSPSNLPSTTDPRNTWSAQPLKAPAGLKF